jgi:hypothetical protein
MPSLLLSKKRDIHILMTNLAMIDDELGYECKRSMKEITLKV